MIIERLTTTGPEIVTLSELKTRIRLDHEADDAYLGLLLTSAHERVENETGHILRPGAFRLTFDLGESTSHLETDMTPVSQLLSQAVMTRDGVYTTLAAEALVLNNQAGWPTLSFNAEKKFYSSSFKRLIIEVEAGYNDPKNVPAQLKLIVLLVAAYWYNAGTCLDGEATSIPAALGEALMPFRRRRL